MIKKRNCILDEDLIRCGHYDFNKHMCKDNMTECGMYNKEYLNPKTYRREPRWYEKYYPKDSFFI